MKMDIRRFSAKDDMETLWHWLELHKAYLPETPEMPAVGFIASMDGHDVAMAFLRTVEGGYAQLDGLVTNPWQYSDLRHYGIDSVVDEVLNYAKEHGIKSVLSFTADASTLMRSRKHGFVQQSLAVMVCNPSSR